MNGSYNYLRGNYMKKQTKQAVKKDEFAGVAVVETIEQDAPEVTPEKIEKAFNETVEVVEVKGELTPQEAAIKMGFILEHGEYERSLGILAIQHVSKMLKNSRDPLSTANRIITAFGCTAVSDPTQAALIAKGLAEQLALKGLAYDPIAAMQNVAARVIKIEKTMPWVFTGVTATPTLALPTGSTINKTKAAGPKRGGNKKEIALAIYNEEIAKTPRPTDSEIARKIEEETKDRGDDSMSFANAFYYVTRVFQKKYSGKSTKVSKKGRK